MIITEWEAFTLQLPALLAWWERERGWGSDGDTWYNSNTWEVINITTPGYGRHWPSHGIIVALHWIMFLTTEANLSSVGQGDDDDDECLPGVGEGVRLCYRWMTLPPIRCQNFVIVQWGQENFIITLLTSGFIRFIWFTFIYLEFRLS